MLIDFPVSLRIAPFLGSAILRFTFSAVAAVEVFTVRY
jgi:hypothetical protein